MTAPTILLIQLVAILVTARARGWLLRHVGRQAFSAAGLVLGPVVAGALGPERPPRSRAASQRAWHAGD